MIASHAANKTEIYKIKKGESLSLIAKKKHTSVATLCEANRLSRNTVLKAGQTIKIPAKTVRKQASTKKYHKRLAKHSTKKQEKRLAKALVRFNSKKVVRVNIKKAHHFTLNDIVFHNNRKYHGKLSSTAKRIIEIAKQKLGRRYVWGATGQHNTFDCSGLTSYVCKLNGIKIPRRAIQQSKYGKAVKRSELQPGDLIFFDTSKHRKGYVNHVGIYIGNGKFIHASSAKKKVIITSLKKPFYSQRFKGARRVASL
jgi:cell wall-associated NlpC family hydrolase